MGTQRIVWHERYRFTGIDSWGHEVAIDGDKRGTGAKPSDLVPLALASCIAYDIVNILHKQRQELRALEATVRTQQDPDPPWTFRKIDVRYVARGDVDDLKARKALTLSEEKYCAVSATLRSVVDLSFDIEVEREHPAPGEAERAEGGEPE